MLLRELNKEEAIAFVNIVTEFINVDQKINVEEKEVLDKYLSALKISKEEVKNIDGEAAVNLLVSAEERIRKIVYLELLGLALIDGEYENSEVDYLEVLAEKFKISRAKKIAFANYYFDYDLVKTLSEEERETRIEKVL